MAFYQKHCGAGVDAWLSPLPDVCMLVQLSVMWEGEVETLVRSQTDAENRGGTEETFQRDKLTVWLVAGNLLFAISVHGARLLTRRDRHQPPPSVKSWTVAFRNPSHVGPTYKGLTFPP